MLLNPKPKKNYRNILIKNTSWCIALIIQVRKKNIQFLKNLGFKGEIIDITDGIIGLKTNGFEFVANTTKIEVDKNQTDTTFKPSGKIIIQVFGNFDYNATQDVDKKYGFWFGRAHFGYEYQFSKQFSAKIIIDGGRPTTIGQISVTDTSVCWLQVHQKAVRIIQ